MRWSYFVFRRRSRVATLTLPLHRKQRQLVPVGVAPRLPLRSTSAFPARRRECALAAKPLDLFVKGFDVLEVPIDGSEAHVCNFIQLPQLIHHELADRARLHLAIAEAAHLV